jgi:hypothetical protein
MRQASGIIRKLIWGFIPTNPQLIIQVGSKVLGKDNLIISEIIEDKNTFSEFGKFEYLIFIAKDNNTKEQFLWKRTFNPDIIEYKISEETEVRLV